MRSLLTLDRGFRRVNQVVSLGYGQKKREATDAREHGRLLGIRLPLELPPVLSLRARGAMYLAVGLVSQGGANSPHR